MPETIDPAMLAPCGIDCVVCLCIYEKRSPVVAVGPKTQVSRDIVENAVSKIAREKKGYRIAFNAEIFLVNF